jgi:hypothetical protein
MSLLPCQVSAFIVGLLRVVETTNAKGKFGSFVWMKMTEREVAAAVR